MNDLRKAYRISILIGGGIAASFFIYIVCVEVIKIQFKPFVGFLHFPRAGEIRYVFYGLAIIQVIAIRLLRALLLKKASSDDLKKIINKLQKASIMTSALCEGPVIFGLTLFLLTGYAMDFYVLLFISLFLMFMYFPRYTQWEEWVKKNNPSDFSSSCL